MKSFFKLFAALVVLWQAPSAHASFGIAPMETALNAPIGGQITDSISVTNAQDTPLHITGSVMDWTLTANGEYRYAEAGTSPDSCANWIQLNPANFILAPHQTVAVRYSINTPADFNREKRAMIFFKSRPTPTKADGGRMSVNISMRVGCKLFITPTSPNPVELDGKITDMDAANADGKVRVSMSNVGIKSMRVKGTIEARDSAGNIVATGRLMPNNAQILPGLTRDLWAEWEKPLTPGTYTFNAALDYGAKTLVGGQMKAEIGVPAAK